MKSVISLMQFATILPSGRISGKTQDLEPFARNFWIYPIAGYVIAELVAMMVIWIPNPTIAAAVAVAGLMIMTGAHHFDGLLDLGDGLMAHGDRKKRVLALTDMNIGAGGVAAGIAVTLLLFAGLAASRSIAAAIIIGEVCAKFSMVLLTTYGQPFREGIHSYLHSFARPYYPLTAAVLCIPLVFLPVSQAMLVSAAACTILCPGALLLLANRLFGGINGDIVGASNEITRACVILVLALA